MQKKVQKKQVTEPEGAFKDDLIDPAWNDIWLQNGHDEGKENDNNMPASSLSRHPTVPRSRKLPATARVCIFGRF